MASGGQIIKYEGDNSAFIWKYPGVNFDTGASLVVPQPWEAVFFGGAQVLEQFEAGSYILKKSFCNDLYFINKSKQMSVKWGTDSKVQYMESTYKFPLQIGASGEMSLRIEDSGKLLIKSASYENFSGLSGLTQMFRSFLMAKLKPCLAEAMQNGDFGIFEIDSYMGKLSDVLFKQLIQGFKDYGLLLESFFITTIVKPDGDKAYEKFKEIHFRQFSDIAEAQLRQRAELIDQQTSAQKMIMESQAMAAKRMQEGYTYQQERSFDIAEKVAQNEGIGGFTNTGIGLGMMGGLAGGMGPLVGAIVTDALNPVMPPDIGLKSDTPEE